MSKGREGGWKGEKQTKKRKREKDRDTTLKPTAPIVFPVVRAAIVGEAIVWHGGGRQMPLVLLVVLECVAVVVVRRALVEALPVACLPAVLHSIIPLIGVLPACFE